MQRGFTLIEAAIACGIVGMTLLALFFALSSFSKFDAHAAGPNRTAARVLAEQTLRIAEDAWKYGAIGNAPSGTWSTTLRIPNAGSATPASIPVTITSALANANATSTSIAITVGYPPDPDRGDTGTITINGTLQVRAPLPGARVLYPSLVPLPSGAP